MSADDIIVRQWDFCEKCKGRGCSKCDGQGKTFKLVPLSSIPILLRSEYTRSQKVFIKEQREKQEANVR